MPLIFYESRRTSHVLLMRKLIFHAALFAKPGSKFKGSSSTIAEHYFNFFYYSEVFFLNGIESSFNE